MSIGTEVPQKGRNRESVGPFETDTSDPFQAQNRTRYPTAKVTVWVERLNGKPK